MSDTTPHRRRPRYSGKYPRRFEEKYKELDPEKHPETIAKVLASGKTPAGSHVPIMVGEILSALEKKKPLPPGVRSHDVSELVMRFTEKADTRKQRQQILSTAQKKLDPTIERRQREEEAKRKEEEAAKRAAEEANKPIGGPKGRKATAQEVKDAAGDD